MRPHIKTLLVVLLMPLMLSLSFGSQLSDEDAWEFIIYFYGFDEEEKKELLALSAEERTSLITYTKELNRVISEEQESGTVIKAPKNFTKEEKESWDFMRLSLIHNKKEIQIAKKKGEALTKEQIDRVIDLSQKLISEYPVNDLSYKQYGRLGNPIPEGWDFLAPQRLDVSSDYVDVWLYRNALNNEDAQIHLSVTKNKEGKYVVEYYEELHASPLKTWTE